MNLLLIGGGGFIGQNLYNYFIRQSHHVIVIDRTVKEREHFLSLEEFGWEKIIAQLVDHGQWVVIDLAYASVPNTSFANPIKDFSENLLMINNTLRAIAGLDVSKYIYFSSGGTVYGNTSEAPITEDAANFPLSPYGITKLACERYVNMHHELHGLNSIIVRPSNVYGPLQAPFRGQGFIATALGSIYKHKPVNIYGTGRSIRDYIYIDDVCEALSRLLVMGESGEIYNLGSGKGCSILDLVSLINTVVKKDSMQLLTELLPSRLFDVGYNVLNSEKLYETIQWRPQISLLEGVENTWSWVKDYFGKEG